MPPFQQESKERRASFPAFAAGDTVNVHVRGRLLCFVLIGQLGLLPLRVVIVLQLLLRAGIIILALNLISSL